MKISWVGLFLISVVASVVSAQQPSAFKPWPNGSREHRPVVPPTQNSTKAAPMLPENASPLFATQLATIQTVGINVLAAKHSVKPDPAIEALREQLKAVSTDLGGVFREGSFSHPILQKGTGGTAENTTSKDVLTPTTPPEPQLLPGTKLGTLVQASMPASQSDASAVGATTTPSSPLPAKNSDAWQNDTASLQNRLTTARAKASGMADVGDPKAPHNRLAKKQKQLFDDIQRAINAKDATQLAALRERLTPRKLPEERERLKALAGPKHKIPSAAPTPTVSTLTKHR